MSKLRRAFLVFSLAVASVLQIVSNVSAQMVEARIKISSTIVASIEGKFRDASSAKSNRNFAFLKSHANIENLGARISDVVLTDKNGQRIEYKKLADGEFLAESDFQSWSYKINLDISKNPSARARVSWLSQEEERGILMLGDLLPEFGAGSSARVEFELPEKWRLASVEKRLGENVFEVSDLEKAVFLAGKNWREAFFTDQSGGRKNDLTGQNALNLLISGEFLFADSEAAKLASEIFIQYQKLFGANPHQRAQIFLVKFPKDIKFGRWEAETRGASVTILSADMPFITPSVQKLHEQLRHEIFHLWIPNGVNLAGNYDWFYEGFALYQSLRTALAVNRIRFEDFLDTLGRAYDIDTLQSRRPSLIEASKNRWNGSNTQVYARGMLVAFLADIALLQKSKGKTSLTEILREIYQKHRQPAARVEGNTAILNILQAREELRPVVEKYIKGPETIVWQTDLEAVGIEARTENFATKLIVKAKPGGRQKDLLDKLGYNNWRNRSDVSQ